MGGLRSVVLAGGGTGGHIYPLLAFADCLRRHDPDVRITCLGTAKGPGEPRSFRPGGTTCGWSRRSSCPAR